MTSSCTGMGCSYPISLMARRISSDTPNSSNVFNVCVFVCLNNLLLLFRVSHRWAESPFFGVLGFLLFPLFQELQCTLYNVAALIDKSEIFIAIPKVVGNGSFEGEA